MSTSLYAPDFLAIFNGSGTPAAHSKLLARLLTGATSGFTSSWSIASTTPSRLRAIYRLTTRITMISRVAIYPAFRISFLTSSSSAQAPSG